MPPRRRPSTSRRSFARTEAPIVRGASTPRRARSWGATGQRKRPRNACGRSSTGSGGNETAALRAKDQRRGEYDRLIREVVPRIQAHESITASATKSAIHNRQSAIDMARTPAVAEFTDPDGGKTARYMLRSPSTRGGAAAVVRRDSGPHPAVRCSPAVGTAWMSVAIGQIP